jgi:hypothetical protein
MPERLALIPPDREDLEQLREIDLMVFHEETLIPPEEQMKRFQYNPEAMLVLKDIETKTVLGDITLSPLRQEVLEKLVNLEIDETEIKPEDYQAYTSDHPQDCYLVTIIARPGIGVRFYAGRLMRGTLEYLIGLLDRGIVIRRIYTVSSTQEEEKLARSLHLTPLPGEIKTEHEEFRRPYVLDLEAMESKSKLVNTYLRHKRNLERRRRRYQRQAQKEGYEWDHPDIFYVLKREEQVIGFTYMLPFKPDTGKTDQLIRANLAGEVAITPDDIVEFKMGQHTQIYLVAIRYETEYPYL